MKLDEMKIGRLREIGYALEDELGREVRSNKKGVLIEKIESASEELDQPLVDVLLDRVIVLRAEPFSHEYSLGQMFYGEPEEITQKFAHSKIPFSKALEVEEKPQNKWHEDFKPPEITEFFRD